MSNPKELGITIAKLRKQAGYSQKQLAEALNITDKAVSKWERGLSCPDISLLSKLSALLDSDIEPLIEGISTINSSSWKGVLIINENDLPVNTMVYDKPLVYYLLSYFLLVGITQVLVICPENQALYIKELYNWNSVGVQILFSNTMNNDFIQNSDIFCINRSVFLFGSAFTRQLQAFMSSSEPITRITTSNNQELPLFFIKNSVCNSDILNHIENSPYSCKPLSRGIISIFFDDFDNVTDISIFVKMYQNQHKLKIADIEEIVENRHLISLK